MLFIYLEIPIDIPSKSIPSAYILLIESGNISNEMSSKFGHQISHLLKLILPKSEETCRIVSNVNFTSFIFPIIMSSSK